MKKGFGFTLVEVLCVLAILGVIAALMISSISQAGLKEQERNKHLLRKAYVSLSQNADNILSNRQNYPSGLLSRSRATNSSVSPSRQINFCDEFISTINTLGDMPDDICTKRDMPTYQTRKHLDNAPYVNTYARIVSSDRMVWWGIGGTRVQCPAGDTQLEGKFCDGSFTNNALCPQSTANGGSKIIIVDVNGTDIQRDRNSATGESEKSKNIFGLDIFRFCLYNNGKVELIDDPLYSPYKSRQGGKLIDSARDLLKDANSIKVRNSG